MAYQTTQQTQQTLQMHQMQQTQEQVSHLPFSYQSTSILNQRLDRIRGGQQEQVSGSPAANSGISQVQVAQVPSSFQTSNSLLPRLEYNQATSQVQLSQTPGSFQFSSQGQYPQENMDQREHRGHMDHQRDHRGDMDNMDQRGQRDHMNQGIPNISSCNPVFSSDACAPSSAPCGRSQGPAYASNCAQEQTSSGCCSSGCCSLSGCCSMLLMTFLGLLGVIWIGLAIAQIVLGSVYLGSCPHQRYIPIYLIVSGTVLLAMILLSFFATLKRGRFLIAFVSILGLFWFAWLIAGSVWTFPLYPIYENIPCNRTVYLFTFAVLIIQWILVGFSLPAILAKVMTLITSCAGSCCSACSSCSLCAKCCSCSLCSSCARCFSCCPCGCGTK